jgi:hypothetical protein
MCSSFVIMLLNPPTTRQRRATRAVRRAPGGLGRGGLLAAELAALFLRIPFEAAPAVPEGYGSAQAVATSLFVDYLLPFEVASSAPHRGRARWCWRNGGRRDGPDRLVPALAAVLFSIGVVGVLVRRNIIVI